MIDVTNSAAMGELEWSFHPVLNPALAERWIAGGRAHQLPEPDFHAIVERCRQTAPVAIEPNHLRLAMLLRYVELTDRRDGAVRAIDWAPPTPDYGTAWAYVQNSGGVVTPARITPVENPEWRAAVPYDFRELQDSSPYASQDNAEQFKRIRSLPERVRHKLFFRRAQLARAANKTPYRFKPKFRKLLLRRMANARAFLTEHAQQELAGRSMDRIDGQEMVALGYDPGRICGVACGFYNNAGRMFKPL
jgi:hypothetical protein